MLLIVVKKNTDSSIRSGSGKKDGAVKLWPSKEPEEQVEHLTVTVIDSIRPPSTAI
jgi:hypothetical protein